VFIAAVHTDRNIQGIGVAISPSRSDLKITSFSSGEQEAEWPADLGPNVGSEIFRGSLEDDDGGPRKRRGRTRELSECQARRGPLSGLSRRGERKRVPWPLARDKE
jgi:hypothetical protein